MRGTVAKGFRFSGSAFDLNVFTDGNWVCSRADLERDTYFAAGGPIAWYSVATTDNSVDGLHAK